MIFTFKKRFADLSFQLVEYLLVEECLSEFVAAAWTVNTVDLYQNPCNTFSVYFEKKVRYAVVIAGVF